MVTAATTTEMTGLMLASVSASLAVFYWRDWQKAIVPSSWRSRNQIEQQIEQDAWDEPLAEGEGGY